MKRMLVLILAVWLLAFPVQAGLAETTIDLSGYSDTELLELLYAVQSEVAVRKIEKTAELTAGTYIGGRDIPVGTYILNSAGTEGEHGIVSLRSVNDPENKYPSKLYSVQLLIYIFLQQCSRSASENERKNPSSTDAPCFS